MNLRMSALAGCIALMGLGACKKDQIAPFQQDVAFIKYYGHVLDQEGIDVKTVVNEEGVREYLILGSTKSFSQTGKYRDFYFVKTDSLGNELWSWKYGDDTGDQLPNYLQQTGLEYEYDEVGRRVIVLADGSGYLLAGTRQRIEKDENGVDVPKEKRIVLYLVDPEGVLVQSTVLRYDDIGNTTDRTNIFSDQLYDIKQLVDVDGTTGLGFVLTGETTNVDTLKPDYNVDDNRLFDRFDIFTARLETDLTPRWSRAYGFIREDRGTSIEIVPDGYIVVGTTNIRESGDFYQQFILVKYKEESGNILNQDNFGGFQYKIESASSCYDAANGVITAVGHVIPQNQSPSSQDGNVLLIQTNTDLLNPDNFQNEVVPTFLNMPGESQAASIHLLPNDDGFIVSATSVNSQFLNANTGSVLSPDIHIMKLNANLGFDDIEKDQKSFGYIKDDAAGTVIPILRTFEGSNATEVESFVFTGTFNLGTNKMMGLVKVNTDLSFDPDGQEE